MAKIAGAQRQKSIETYPEGPGGKGGGIIAVTCPLQQSGGTVSLVYSAIKTAVSTSPTCEDQFIAVTTTPGVVITLSAAFTRTTVKDQTGSNNPLIGVAPPAGGATIEDPNNLGTFVAGTVFIKITGGGVTWRKNADGNWSVEAST